jgi:long-chain fatty acid transport protein
MRNRRFVVPCLLAGLLAAQSAAATSFGLFQHGGRAMGQAGAFTARASEPSALTYNPAAITRLDGLQFQAGLDFRLAEIQYDSPTGSFSARHIIDFPPAAYLTWKPGHGPFAFGLGLDAPFWYKNQWQPRLFPGRFLQRQFELTLLELHPVLAYDLGDGWSVGGGIRYVAGDLRQDDNVLVSIPFQGLFVPVELERNTSAQVDDLTWDLGIHYAAPSWGWGAVYRNKAELKGSGDVHYTPRDLAVAGLETPVSQRFSDGRARQAFEIPSELRGGIWFAPYPELRVEIDAAWQSWSSLESTAVTYTPDPVGDGPTIETPRRWDDTISLRLGLEGNVTDNFMLYGGVSQEPSPVPDRTVEPGIPKGDAMVYAAGFSYSFPAISFDVGYSFHMHDDRGARGQEPEHPAVRGSYSGDEQVWGFSVRWRR